MKKIYFIGIGGIGMSALARYYNRKDYKVYGYDKTATILTKKLEEEGMEIHYVEDVSLIEKDIEMVVYTPAIPKDHKELNWYSANGYTILKRAEVLGLISKESKTIAVAGTHGKTTTSSLLAHILHYNAFDFTGFLGGINLSFDSNFVAGESEWVVLEADEYDRSFLHLKPRFATLMSIDADHLDVYGSSEDMREGFKDFTYGIQRGGKVFVKEGVVKTLGEHWVGILTKKQIEIIEFGEGNCGLKINSIKIEEGWQVFGFNYKTFCLEEVKSPMPGKHNIENVAVAMCLALELGLSGSMIKAAVKDFKGIKRRFEFVIRREDLVVIDDYAHHPTELRVTIEAVKDLYPEKKVLGVFQPHLYSRTNDFYKEFATALDGLNEVLLLDVYPARELPMEGVSSKLILDEMKIAQKSMVSKERLIQELAGKKYDVLVILGAGDIGEMVEGIVDAHRNK